MRHVRFETSIGKASVSNKSRLLVWAARWRACPTLGRRAEPQEGPLRYEAIVGRLFIERVYYWREPLCQETGHA